MRTRLNNFLFHYLDAVERKDNKIMGELTEEFLATIESEKQTVLLGHILPPPASEFSSVIEKFKGRDGWRNAWNTCRMVMIENFKNVTQNQNVRP